MKKINTTSFLYCRDGELIKNARRILDSLKQNTSFPNANPLLEAIEKALEEYIAASICSWQARPGKGIY